MNILYFCQIYAPLLYGGGEYIFFHWAKELAKRGHKIYVISQNIEGESNFDNINGIVIYRVGPNISFSGNLPTNFSENLGYLIMSLLVGIDLIRKKNINLIHSNTYIPVLSGTLCSIITKIPHVVTFHDVYSKKIGFWYHWSKQKNIPLSTRILAPIIEQLILKLPIDIIHTVSNTSKQDLLNYVSEDKIIIIPNGVDYCHYICNKGDELNGAAIYIGRLINYKNISTIIKAFKQYNISKHHKGTLLIVGDGPYRSELEKLAFSDNRITFKGRVSESEKIRLLYSSSFLMLPSIMEGFGIVILEAYACKKPVIVSDIMPLPELVDEGKTGYIVPAFDIKEWENKIAYLFKHPSFAKKMGEAGFNKMKNNYTIKKVVDKMENLYYYTVLRR